MNGLLELMKILTVSVLVESYPTFFTAKESKRESPFATCSTGFSFKSLIVRLK